MKKFTSALIILMLLFTSTNYMILAEENIIDVSSMMTTIETLSANPRGYENKEIELARQFIIDKFNDYGLDVTTQEFETNLTDWNGNKFVAVNIIGTLKSNTEVKTDDILIIGAHYDGINNIPAANDNASGISVMLELIRLLHDIPTDTEIRFVAFDAEEVGLIGSEYYASHLGDDINRTIGMLNIDMVGSTKAGSVSIFSSNGNENYLSDILKKNKKYTNIAVSRDFGRSDHMSFYPKQIPDLNFAHKPIQNEYHCENDIIENINPNMLAYVANAVQIIALEIMSESTPSYISIAKPIPDNTVYTIENNIRIPFGWLTEFEKTTGIKLSQIPSADTNAVYQAKVKMFGMPEILTLTASSGIGVIGGVEHFSVNMQQVGITFEKLNEVLTNLFGSPSQNEIQETDTVIYDWHNIFGNTYSIILNKSNNTYSFHIVWYRGAPDAEGYTINGGELVRMEQAVGSVSVHITEKDGEIIHEEHKNLPSNTLPITDNAKRAWAKIKPYLSDDEINTIVFLCISTDGIGGGQPISIEKHIFDEEEFENKIKSIKDKEYYMDYSPTGIYLYLDDIDLLNSQGNCFVESNLSKNLSIARATARGKGCTDIPSEWAVNDVVNAIKADILPSELQSNYQTNITREQFCDLAFALLEKISGLKWHTAQDMLFEDTNNMSVGTLYKQGIINGKAKGIFAPHDFITREEAATILDRICEYVDISGNDAYDFRFHDDEAISEWAKSGVYHMQFIGIMNGVGDDLFAPQDTYTVEQAILTMVRIYDYH